MATNTMVMSYVLRKFKNDRSSVNNRWFAYVNREGPLFLCVEENLRFQLFTISLFCAVLQSFSIKHT